MRRWFPRHSGEPRVSIATAEAMPSLPVAGTWAWRGASNRFSRPALKSRCDNVRMAWIETISEGAAQGDLRRSYDAAVKRARKVWNIVKVMSLSPPTLRASMGLYLASVRGPSPLTRAHREMLAVVVSKANNCHY